MLTGITNKREIQKLVEQSIKKFEKHFSHQENVRISFRTGTPSGEKSYKISYSNELGIWWYFGKTVNRYWNCFGTNNQIYKNYAWITVEINMPFEGKNLRCSGLWAKDEKNNYYLLHDGGIGGGKKGVGKSLFVSNFDNEKFDVLIDGKEKPYYFVAQLNNKNFIYQVTDFVKEIKRIKNIIETQKEEETKSQQNGTGNINKYSDEFFGIKSYSLPEKVTVNCKHGLIVKKFKELLEENNYNIRKNQKIDLCTFEKNKIKNIFEIKSGLSRQTVYTAIGQLFLNGLETQSNPQKIFVCPNDIDTNLIKDLKKMNINVITFKWKNNEPIFDNLEILNLN